MYCLVVSGFVAAHRAFVVASRSLCLPQTPESTGSGSVQARAPETAGSVVVVCRPCGMWDLIVPGTGIEPCPLHWKVYS